MNHETEEEMKRNTVANRIKGAYMENEYRKQNKRYLGVATWTEKKESQI